MHRPHRSHLLWLLPAAILAVFGVQCVASLSDDCTRTLTCGAEPHATLDSQCRWRFPDGGIWTEGPHRTPEGRWVWPDGKETQTQDFQCPPGDGALGDAGPTGVIGADCSSAACDAPQVCNPATKRCVQCLDNTSCTTASSPDYGALAVCDKQNYECVACLQDADCSGTPLTPYCKPDANDPSHNHCVACLRTAQCKNGEVCDITANECTSKCTGVGTCSNPAKPICSLPAGASVGVCVECLTGNDQCQNGTQCNLSTKQCVQCVDNTPCGAQVCNGLNHCVQCTDDTQCSGSDLPYCDLTSYSCVACLDSHQCASTAASRCNVVTHTCTTCTLDSQCEAGAPFCNPDGKCVACRDSSSCSGETPVCDTTTGACVGCNADADCSLHDNLGRCDTATHQCVGCTASNQCTGKFPPKDFCRTGDGHCVECVGNADCADDAASSRCDQTTGLCSACQVAGDCSAIAGKPACATGVGAHCVECVTNDDCTNPAASKCVANQCTPCGVDADCSKTGTTALPACDTSASTHTCVQCTAASRTACGTKVCNSLTKVCSDQEAGSAESCAACVSDDQCSTGGKCAQETFQTTAVGYFCFPASSGVCNVPGFNSLTTITTIDGNNTSICMPMRTTCPAIQQLRTVTVCTADADCGVANLNDGLCDVSSTGACSTPCVIGSDCLTGSCRGTGICQ